jgi:hypothetical protein
LLLFVLVEVLLGLFQLLLELLLAVHQFFHFLAGLPVHLLLLQHFIAEFFQVFLNFQAFFQGLFQVFFDFLGVVGLLLRNSSSVGIL